MKNMKRIIVTPAGRKQYLEILLENLIKCRNEFDEWHLWMNTTNQDDIVYIESLKERYSFIVLKKLNIEHNGIFSIHSFFKDYIKVDEVYLRLDDDIVYVQKNSINTMFDERINDTQSFLLYGNIINNSIITYIHQRVGNLSTNYGICGYDCMDHVGWSNPQFAENLHRDFLENKDKKDFYIPNWLLYNYERVSINCISWRGDEFQKFNGSVGVDEEQWLSVDKPLEIQKPNRIIGGTLFSHYSFFPQREHLDKTDILEKYKQIKEL